MRLFDDRYVTMTRGDTMSFNMELDGIDELGAAFFTCRKNYTEAPVFQKTIGHGITKQSAGVYCVRIAPEDTEGLEAGKYYYDLELCVNDDVFTVLKGVLELEQDVTY